MECRDGRAGLLLSITLPLILSSCGASTPTKDGRIVVRNDSHQTIAGGQVNVVDEYPDGRLISNPQSAWDQIITFSELAAGSTIVIPYESLAEENIDILVRWQDGRTARFNVGYVSEWWHPKHTLSATDDGLLFDGKPPAPIQAFPEENQWRRSLTPRSAPPSSRSRE